MQCKLCLQEKSLLRQSHIVPNFIYKELRDEDNSFLQGNLDNLSKEKKFTGNFESNILCRECDNNLLGKIELYGSKILYGGKIQEINMINEITPDGAEWTKVTGVDYKRFKLFLLSILWRMGIAKNEFYRFVNLGKHEEIIRKMILEGNPGKTLDYPCAISSYRKHKEIPFQMISQPMKHRNNNGICYSVVMNGLVYDYFMSKALTPNYIAEITINENSELKVIHIPKDNALKIIKRHFRVDFSSL